MSKFNNEQFEARQLEVKTLADKALEEHTQKSGKAGVIYKEIGERMKELNKMGYISAFYMFPEDNIKDGMFHNFLVKDAEITITSEERILEYIKNSQRLFMFISNIFDYAKIYLNHVFIIYPDGHGQHFIKNDKLIDLAVDARKRREGY